MAEARFLRPLGAVFPRGNRLFGGSGEHGEAQMPPWPSVAAGAVRSRMLSDAGADLSAFSSGQPLESELLAAALGTPHDPGRFRVSWFSLAQRFEDRVEPVLSLPADVVVDDQSSKYLLPTVVPSGLRSSAASQVPLLRQLRMAKPIGGLWLNGAGIAAWAEGKPLHRPDQLVTTSELWRTEMRIGIALDPRKRSAADGALYTTEAIVLNEQWRSIRETAEIGFLVRIDGADGVVPGNGMVRFGGDGRGARIDECAPRWPEPDIERVVRERRFRLVLTTPGLFAGGWRPTGAGDDGASWLGPGGISARLVCAAIPKAQVISGWDLAKRGPKPALRAAPAGSVYWFDQLAGNADVVGANLRKLASEGFAAIDHYPDRSRTAEGFNNLLIAPWVGD